MYSHSPYYRASAKSQLSLNSDTSSSMSIHLSEFPQVPSSPSSSSSSFGNTSPRYTPNFEGSWLDIESEDEDIPRRLTTSRSRRRSSAAKDPSSRSALTNFRELTQRGSAQIRKLTSKMAR